MEKQAVITATDLCIGYRTHKGEKKVHEHLSFGLYPGELTSLLGANGAGKSTLLRTLSASQPSLAGDLQLLGKPLQQYSEKERSRTIGVVLTDKTQAGGLTVYELVALGRQPHTGFFGRLHPKDHLIIKEALDAVGIAHKAESYTAELSDGERQKVMIAKALVQECPLIILDEPTAMLDPNGRKEVIRAVRALNDVEGITVILITHYMEEVEILCDRIIILDRGKIIAQGTSDELKALAKIEEKVTIETKHFKPEFLEKLQAAPNVDKAEYAGHQLVITYKSGKNNVAKLIEELSAAGITCNKIFSERPTLNDVFLELTGKELRD